MDDIRLQYSINGNDSITVRLPGNRAVVGSSPQADIRIESRFLSRQHFLIEVQGDRIFVTDLGSSNGTTLDGRRLQPNVRQEWRSGETLSVADVRFSLNTPGFIPAETAPVVGGSLNMIAEPDVIYPGQTSTVTVQYSGDTPQPIYFRTETDTEGLDVQISPAESFIQPGQAINVMLDAYKTRALWTGGTFPVTLFALTNSGLDTLTQVTVRVRPRYGLLLLLLLLLLIPAGIAGAALLTTPTTQTLPTTTPLPTVITATVTTEPSATSEEPTATSEEPTATDVPTETPIPTDVPSATPFPTSTLIPSREPSVTPVIVITVIQPPPIIVIPPVFVPPQQPQQPPQQPQLSCNGFRATSPFEGLPNGPASFFWSPPTNGGVVNYQLTVTNLDSGQSTSRSLPGGSTSASVDVGLGALGQGFNFNWTIRASLFNGQSCTDSVSLQRAFCDGTQYNPCPGVRAPLDNLAISSLLPDIFADHFQQEANTTRSVIDIIGDLLILLAIGGALVYGLH
ncbi:MAG: FHA domain-containing protein, partial [Anaerolineae bacterium]|nr:FHA domain-containing protein [Anaerolineae bacterium]